MTGPRLGEAVVYKVFNQDDREASDTMKQCQKHSSLQFIKKKKKKRMASIKIK